MDSAKRTFALVDSLYDIRLKKNPENFRAIVGKITLKAVSGGKDEATKELMEQIRKHPKYAAELMEEKEVLVSPNGIATK